MNEEEKAAREAYRKAYTHHKKMRGLIGNNDLKALNGYNANNLSSDYSKLMKLKKAANFSTSESLVKGAKATFPHVGQQIKGTVSMLVGKKKLGGFRDDSFLEPGIENID